jgi:predicted enzyme related to lactoylglutathione lyase
MNDFNSTNNRAVWFDIPVADLSRATSFYSHVLAINIAVERVGEIEFAVLDHDNGNGGCLVPGPEEVSADKGLLVYLNANGRLRDAVRQATAHGGTIVEDVHSLGPHGFRAILLDSEGNRIALHSETDADGA